MILEQLKLYNIRCYEQLDFTPDPKFNVIVGLNGQGKTTVLEAIGLIASLKSFRNAKNSEIVKTEQGEGRITGHIGHQGLDFRLDVKVWPKRKQGTFNGKACRYLSEYVGKLSAVSFSPIDLEIVRGAPENRRTWLDKQVLIFHPDYVDALNRYQKILEQRNRQLKMAQDRGRNELPSDFQTWSEELCFWGSQIIHKRIHIVDKVVDYISKYYEEISHKKEDISIQYLSKILAKVPYGQWSSISLELIAQALRDSLEEALPREIIMGSTMVGPHRDDLEIKMGGNPARAFGSQGEIRSLVLAMRLTEVELYKNVRGLDPLLLIDDFSSELDAFRRKYLLDYLISSGSQVFLTTTEDLKLGKVFTVNEGKLR
jgi:DNA replication and repair protein RecF